MTSSKFVTVAGIQEDYKLYKWMEPIIHQAAHALTSGISIVELFAECQVGKADVPKWLQYAYGNKFRVLYVCGLQSSDFRETMTSELTNAGVEVLCKFRIRKDIEGALKAILDEARVEKRKPLLVFDESDYGTTEHAVTAKIVVTAHELGFKIVLMSATTFEHEFAHLKSLKLRADWSTLRKGGYYGIPESLSSGKIVDIGDKPLLNKKGVLSEVAETFVTEFIKQKRYKILFWRVNSIDEQNRLVSTLKGLGFGFRAAGRSGIIQTYTFDPKSITLWSLRNANKPTIVIVNKLLIAGERLPCKRNTYGAIEPGKDLAVLIQRLGRFPGWGRNNTHIRFLTNKSIVENYTHFVKFGVLKEYSKIRRVSTTQTRRFRTISIPLKVPVSKQGSIDFIKGMALKHLREYGVEGREFSVHRNYTHYEKMYRKHGRITNLHDTGKGEEKAALLFIDGEIILAFRIPVTATYEDLSALGNNGKALSDYAAARLGVVKPRILTSRSSDNKEAQAFFDTGSTSNRFHVTGLNRNKKGAAYDAHVLIEDREKKAPRTLMALPQAAAGHHAETQISSIYRKMGTLDVQVDA